MLTDALIRSATTSVSKGQSRYCVMKDPGERGAGRLTIHVRATKKAPAAEWYVTWQRDGTRHSVKIGTYPTMSLAEARTTFQEDYRPRILDGRDPIGPRTWRRKGTAATIKEMMEAYINDLERRGKPGAERFDRLLLGPHGLVQSIGPSRPASEVKADDIMPHLQAMYDRDSKDLAEFVRAAAHAAFQWALKSRYDVSAKTCGEDWGLRGNPVASIKRIQRNPPRDRALTPMEFRDFWFWLDDRARFRRYRIPARAIQLIMATGQRPGEILQLTKTHYDPLEAALSWPKTKNGKPHSIPLCRQAEAILKDLEPNARGLYFPKQRTPDEPATVDTAAKLIHQFIDKTVAQPFQLRDLRRTWKTLAGDVGISKEARDRLQNHTYGDVSSRHYDHSLHWPIKCRAVDEWSNAMNFILYSTEPVNRRALVNVPQMLRLEARVVEDDDQRLREEHGLPDEEAA